MKISDFRFQISNFKLVSIILMLIVTLLPTVLFAESKWTGVDESVVEKYAEEHGRAPRDPIINTDHGDLLLFVFLLAGAVGGFLGGYYWRTLIEPSNRVTDVGQRNTEHRQEGIDGCM